MEQKTFEQRRKKLANLSDDQLQELFWDLTDQIVSPMVDLARTHTSPAIERSILLRCGFSSLEAKNIVDNAIKHKLLAKGAGNCVLRLARKRNIPVLASGKILAADNGWEEVRDNA